MNLAWVHESGDGPNKRRIPSWMTIQKPCRNRTLVPATKPFSTIFTFFTLRRRKASRLT